MFRLITILWLSLPRFQGALFVYDELVDGLLMEKYRVHDKIESKIQHVKKSAKDAAWRITADLGWSALSQVGEMVSFVQNSASTFAENNNQNANDITCRTDSNNHVNHHHELESSSSSSSRHSQHATHHSNSISMKKEHSTESLLTRKPSHSVLGSLSSFSSVESISDVVEKQSYIHDFLSMLKQGLYVFAWSAEQSESELQSDADPDASKRFRLRVFFYESGDVNVDNNDNDDEVQPYFVIHPVESNQDIPSDDIDIIPIQDVKEFRASGTNGIQFIVSNHVPLETEEDVQRQNDEGHGDKDQDETEEKKDDVGENMKLSSSEPSLVQSTSTSSISSIPSDRGDTGNDRVLVEIVLSNEQDRETLLQGLIASFQPLGGDLEDDNCSDEHDGDDEHDDDSDKHDDFSRNNGDKCQTNDDRLEDSDCEVVDDDDEVVDWNTSN